MDNPIPAIYEKGVLRPLTPLPLTEQTHVQIYVHPLDSQPSEHRNQIRNALVEAGLSLPALQTAASHVSDRLSPERREELAGLFAQGEPLSEIIIAEREK